MNKTFIRIPALPLAAVNELDRESMTLSYLDTHQEALDVASRLLYVLARHESDDAILKNIKDMEEGFSEATTLAFFDEQNLATWVEETHRNANAKLKDMEQMLLKRFPIFSVIGENMEITEERKEKATALMYNELYPLYCMPKAETIRHFIDHCGSIGFMNINGSYFAYLTSSGQSFHVKIAYAYLKVDGCIPDNYAVDNVDLKLVSETVRNDFKAFLTA